MQINTRKNIKQTNYIKCFFEKNYIIIEKTLIISIPNLNE